MLHAKWAHGPAGCTRPFSNFNFCPALAWVAAALLLHRMLPARLPARLWTLMCTTRRLPRPSEACARVSEQVASNTYDSEINLGLGGILSPVCGEVEEPPPPLPIELQAMRVVLLQRIPVRDGQQSNPASNCAASEAE